MCPGNEGSELTVFSPDKRTLGLLTRLADQSLKHTGEMGEIFQSDLRSSCNALIHLKSLTKEVTGSVRHHSKGSYFPGSVGFDPPARYVADLTAAYGEMFSFLYSEGNPEVVGVVCRVSGVEESKFTVNKSQLRCPGGEDMMVKYNLDAALSDFTLLGKGLVKSIEVLKMEV